MTARTKMRLGTASLERGFTLMETLVTLVVVSMVSGLLWQALAQTARVERMLDAGALEPQSDALRLLWVRRAIESLIPLAPEDPNHFQGSVTRLSGLASDAPGWPTSPAAAFELELLHDVIRGTGELVLRLEGGRDTPARVAITLARWKGEPGSLRYLGPEGRWSDTWPPVSVSDTPRPLPLAVAIVTGTSPPAVIVAAPRSQGGPRLTRAQLEKM
jgi:prepilin-type N-terminal cleavage/methylation domain-containing protein